MALAGLAILLVIATWEILPTVLSGKATGNAQAALVWRNRMARWKSSKETSSQFDFYKLPAVERQNAISSGLMFDAWIKTNFPWGTAVNREVVLVCGRKFHNGLGLSIRNLFRHPSHLVAYSDGSVGLISPEQFTNFDFLGFVSTRNLATNSDFKVFVE